MLRGNKLAFAALLTMLLPATASAETVEITGGGFVFTHAPAVPSGICLNPPGLYIRVKSQSFYGDFSTENATVFFAGDGKAAGIAYLQPVDGVAAEFTGSFTWQTPGGELRGTFDLVNYPTANPLEFEVVVWFTFTGGAGRFRGARGEAVAQGFDYPFGGLDGDLLTAGVAADILEGELILRD